MEERYASRQAYLGSIAAAALDLVEQGYLLRQDMPEIVKQAARHWDFLSHGAAQ